VGVLLPEGFKTRKVKFQSLHPTDIALHPTWDNEIIQVVSCKIFERNHVSAILFNFSEHRCRPLIRRTMEVTAVQIVGLHITFNIKLVYHIK
jgi:hypothetical protein